MLAINFVDNLATFFTFVEGSLHGIGKASKFILNVFVDAHAINHQFHILWRDFFLAVDKILNLNDFAIDKNPVKPLLHENVEMFGKRTVFGQQQRRRNVNHRAFFQGHDEIHHVHHLVLLDQFAGNGGVGLANSGEKQFQKFVNLCACAHCGAWIVGAYLLFDGDGRREAGDAFHVGLVQSAHELARVGTQALHITALTFGIQGVESQRRLART